LYRQILQHEKHQPHSSELCEVQPVTEFTWLADEKVGIMTVTGSQEESQCELLGGRYFVEKDIYERNVNGGFLGDYFLSLGVN
jgi:hypothetical protein